MAIRIPWDIREAAILLQALISVLNNKERRKRAIAEVSQTLRKLAIKQGVSVDDKFRNENGIALQMSKLEYAFTDGKLGLRVQTGWYFDIVRLYREERGKYYDLLREVKAMSVPDTKEQKSFDVWLAENGSSNAASIKATINILSVLLLKNKAIRDNVLQITDVAVIDSLINRIKANKGIHIHSKRQKNNCLAALGVYKNYLECLAEETANEQFDIPDAKGTVLNLEAEEEKGGTLRVSFAESRIYSYTRPSELIYFDEHYPVRNWTQVYVQTVKCLYMDFPNKICSLMNSSLSGRGRIDVADSIGADAMIAPKEISDDLYLETNESADTIITKIGKLLNICEVDFKNVVITYSASKIVSEPNASAKATQADPHSKNISFYQWMTQTQGMAEGTGRSYDSAINTADVFAKEHHIGNGKIRGITDYIIVKETADALLQNPVFIELNQKQHNRFRAALRKYLQYLNNGQYTGVPELVEDSSDDVDFEPYREILSICFTKGFRIASRLDMGRFRTFWLKKYGSELTEDDDTVRKYIAHITVQYQDFVYLPETMLDEGTAERLLAYLDGCFREGKNAVYFDALYKEFQIEFVGKRINNPNMLKSYLTYINDDRFFVHRSYLTAEVDAEVNPTDEVKDYLITAGVPVSVEDLKEALAHIDEDKIIWAVAGSNSAEFVRNQKGEYFHADIVRFTQPEIDSITELIQQAIDDKDYMGGKELTDAIEIKLPGIRERYPFLTWLGLRDVIAYKLRDVFSFKGKIISAYGQDLSMSDVFAHFASSHDHFTLEQLNSLKRDLDTPIYFDSVYENSLRISKDEFVSREQEVFDVAATDAAIDRFCVGDYIALKEISFFGSFPDARFPWNEFLLEHYAANFSKEYKLLHVGYTAGTTVGAIVKRSSRFEDFDELISADLADSNIPLNRQSALQYLVDVGFIARRHFSGIDQILTKAKLQRSKKG